MSDRSVEVKNYTMADMKLGLTESFTITVTEEKMQQFRELSGDISPIHMQEAYAAERGYPGRVCYGMLVASFFSTLAGVLLPGKHCLLYSVESKFVKPVFVGDTLTVTGTVEEINAVFSEVKIRGIITNQHGKRVCRGTLKAGVVK